MKRILAALLVLVIGMAAITPVVSAEDVDWYTKFLLHFDTAINEDEADYQPWTYGNATLNTTTKKFGASSGNFSSAAVCWVAATADNAAYNASIGNFTVDFWAYKQVNATASQTILTSSYSRNPSAWIVYEGTSVGIAMIANTSGVGGASYTVSAGTTPYREWTHFAFTRDGEYIRAYRNGVLMNSTALASTAYLLGTSINPSVGGRSAAATQWFNGVIDEPRYSQNIVRFNTSNFTVPSEAYSPTNGLFAYRIWNYTTPGVYSWTCPADLNYIGLFISGGGGGGMGAYNTSAAPYGSLRGLGGYGAESYNLSRIPVVPGQTYSIVVGQGGDPGIRNTATSFTGDSSTAFGISAAGGEGGELDTTVRDVITGGGVGESTWYMTSTRLGTNGTGLYNGTGGYGYGAGGAGGGHGAISACIAYDAGGGANGTVRIIEEGWFYEPTPDFNATPTSGAAGTTITFRDLSDVRNPDGIVYEWDWGDGTPHGSTIGDTSHIYASPGTYSPSLTITTTSGTMTTVKEAYIAITGGDTTTWYSPNQVRLTVLDWLGNNVVGASVNATYVESTLPDAVLWLTSVYGIEPTVAQQMLTTGTVMNGTTGDDGAIVFTMHSSVQYNITVQNGTTVRSVKLYPRESDYNIWLSAPTYNSTYAQVGWNLTYWQTNSSYMTLGMTYKDNSSHTQRVTFYVNATNGTVINYTTMINPGNTELNITKTIPNIRGTQFYWGMKAVRTTGEGGNISLDRGVTAKGANGVLVDLGLPGGVTYYPWIAFFLLLMITSLASKNNVRFMLILMVAMAAMFWWFGWLSGTYLTSVIPFVGLLAAVFYMKGSLRENYGIGGSGSMLINIVVFLIIMQMMIGFINGLGVFNQASMVTPTNQYTNVDLTTIQNSTSNFGGINDPLQSANAYASIGWATLKILLSMIGAIFFVGIFLYQMFPYFPVTFLAVIQGGIYVMYVLFIAKVAGKLGSEVDL